MASANDGALKRKDKICTVCQTLLSEFSDYGIPPRNGQCPHCGAKARHRDLFHFIDQILLKSSAVPNLKEVKSVLDVGPSKVTTRYLPKHFSDVGAIYTAIDIRELAHHKALAPPHRFLSMDATQMSFASNSFDLVMANAVLPFIPEAQQAIAEVSRVLKASGVAVLNSHITNEKSMTTEQYRKLHPELTEEYLEMSGTSWFFGTDYLDILMRAELKSVMLNYNALLPAEVLQREGLKSDAKMILAAKDESLLKQVQNTLAHRASVSDFRF